MNTTEELQKFEIEELVGADVETLSQTRLTVVLIC